MSRRREAAELAHALALSTQQVRDIYETNPHTYSSNTTSTTQDSKELELRIIGMSPTTDIAPTDEITLFSSRRLDDQVVVGSNDIRNFTSSDQTDPKLLKISDSSNDPQNGDPILPHRDQPRTSPAVPRTAAIGNSSSGHAMFSPTQTSDRVAPKDHIIAKQRKDATSTRTPLQQIGRNREFQLSLSPEPPSSKRTKTASAAVQHRSPPVEVRAHAFDRPDTSSSSSRNKLYPEIVLSSKAHTPSRHESPDPLSCLPDLATPSAAGQQPNVHPASSTTSSAHRSVSPRQMTVESGRRSSRVQAATEKKEAEKEERRRLRRERKAKEEEERARLARDGRQHMRTSSTKKDADPPAKISRVIVLESRSVPTSGLDRPDSGTSVSKSQGSPKTSVLVPKKRGRLELSGVADGSPESGANEVGEGSSPAPNMIPQPDQPRPTHDSRGSSASPEKPSHGPSDLDGGPGLQEQKVDGTRQQDVAPATDTNSTITIASRHRLNPNPVTRHSPGPAKPDGQSPRPGAIRWQTPRSDLSSVLAKFPGSRPTGMSKRHRIAPLHAKIGPPAKGLPPVPQKPTKRKQGEESEEEDEEETRVDAEDESETEGGTSKKKKGKGIEWFMMED